MLYLSGSQGWVRKELLPQPAYDRNLTNRITGDTRRCPVGH
jgi:hypothetical protein